MEKTKEEIVKVIEAYIALCTAAVTTDSGDVKKHVLIYAQYRQQLMNLRGVIDIPAWVETSTNLGTLKSNIDLKVEGGTGSWARRRAYLQSEMNVMANSYKGNDVTKELLMPLDDLILPQIPTTNANSNIVASNGPLSGSSTVVGNLNNYNVLRNNMSNERKKVFIVHGHDSKLKHEVQSLLFREGFDPIILHDQTNNGDTIIEKLERYIEQVSFAIVLYTGCDIGRANYLPESGNKARARQNVVFEHGYLISKLSRKRVVALRAEGVEVPGDLDGLVYLDVPGWEYRLSKELNSCA